MATGKQTKAALKNVTKAREAATSSKTIVHMSEQTRTTLGQQGAAVAQRKPTGGCVGRTASHRNSFCDVAPSSGKHG
jgi:hypothetical protein